MTITFGPPSYNWDGGVQSLFAKEALGAFYHLLSVDSGPAGAGVTLIGTTQQSGYQIAATNTWISSSPVNGAVVLPETSTPYSLSGVKIYVTNTSVNSIAVYAHPADAGNSINGSAPNAAYAVPPGTFQILHCFAPGKWLAAPQANFVQVAGLVVGGSIPSSTLTLESTSGVGTTDFINFKTGSQVEAMRIDTNGVVVFGGVAAQTFNFVPQVQLNGINQTDSSLALARWSSSSGGGANLIFYKSRGGTKGVNVAVQSTDQLGVIAFNGADGTNWNDAAYIIGNVDGAVSTGSVPARLGFFTAGANASPLEHLRIDSLGNILGFGGATASFATSAGQFILTNAHNLGSLTSPGAYGGIDGTNTSATGAAYFMFTHAYGGTGGGGWGERFYTYFARNIRGSEQAVGASDLLGGMAAQAYDGTAYHFAGKIDFLVDGTVSTGVIPSRITFAVNASNNEVMRIDNTGQIIANQLNTAGALGGNVAGLVRSASFGNNYSFSAEDYSNDATTASIQLFKSRGTSFNSLAAVANNDGVGGIDFNTTEGTFNSAVARIIAFVDGTVTGGTRVPGRLAFYTEGGGSPAAERLRINSGGSVMMSAAALATSATDGFFYMNSCAGAPTGAPTAAPGAAAAMVIDTTNSKIWVRIGGTWKGVVVA